jgi:hypothetical protein
VSIASNTVFFFPRLRPFGNNNSVLDLSRCSLTSVPKAVGELSALRALVLTGNQLTRLARLKNKPELNSLSTFFRNTILNWRPPRPWPSTDLRAVWYPVVSNNRLTSLPSSVGSLASLTRLSASHNLLEADGLPDLSALSKLEQVRLGNNPTLKALPDHFARWAAGGLKLVGLSSCGFEGWEDLRPLAGHEGLENFELKANPIAEREKETDEELYRSKVRNPIQMKPHHARTVSAHVPSTAHFTFPPPSDTRQQTIRSRLSSAEAEARGRRLVVVLPEACL